MSDEYNRIKRKREHTRIAGQVENQREVGNVVRGPVAPLKDRGEILGDHQPRNLLHHPQSIGLRGRMRKRSGKILNSSASIREAVGPA